MCIFASSYFFDRDMFPEKGRVNFRALSNNKAMPAVTAEVRANLKTIGISRAEHLRASAESAEGATRPL